MERQIKWYHGLLALALFGGIMALEYFGLLGHGGWLTTTLGEVLFAAAAIAVVLIARVKPSTVFCFKKVHLLSLAGLYLMWRSLIMVSVWLTEVAIYFFPKLGQESDGLNEMMMHIPFWLAMLLVAVMPAVCEELLFRGPILRSLGFMKIPLLIIVVDGVIFAAAHLSFVKMIPITMLGIFLAYLVYTSDNMAYSMIVHFINNSMSVILVYTLLGLGGGSTEDVAVGAAQQLAQTTVPLSALGLTLCGCTLSPILFYIGHYLFKRGLLKDTGHTPGMPIPFKLKKEWLFLTGAVGLLIFSFGTLLFALGFEEMMALSGM